MISRRIILPLILVIILSGLGGVVAAKHRIETQLQQAREAAEIKQAPPASEL